MLLFLFGCAQTLQPDPFDTATVDTGPAEVIDETDENGLTFQSTTFNTTDHEAWVYLDLETGEVGEDTDWDIALQRYKLALRGGLIGEGEVLAVQVKDTSFEDLTVAPSDGYTTDLPDADKDGTDEYVLGTWYDYDPSTHILNPNGAVYAIATPDSYQRLQVLDYYNDAGTSGHLTIQWGAIDAPATE